MSVLSSPNTTPNHNLSNFEAYEKETIQTDIQTFQNENDTLKQFSKEITDIQASITKHKQTAESNRLRLSKELDLINHDLGKADRELKEFNSKHVQEKEEIIRLRTDYNFTKKKRWAIADTIELKTLNELKMEDRKSVAHEVFKWIISVIYKEPSSKYYWENFKAEAFSNDKGNDFKERMGKMSASDLKEDEKVHTQKFLELRKQLIEHKDFSKGNAKNEITKIFDIATLILEGSELSRRSKELDALDNKIKDEELLKLDAKTKLNNKASAIQERVDMNLQYQRVLAALESKMEDKGKIYSEIINEGNKIIADMKENKESTVTKVGTPKPETPQRVPYNKETEKTDACTCLLF